MSPNKKLDYVAAGQVIKVQKLVEKESAVRIATDEINEEQKAGSTNMANQRKESRPSPANDPPIVVVVMGLTGSGKSYFIAQLTGDMSITGDSLESVTQEVVSYEVIVKGKRISVLDTPGFNDTRRSDSVVLQEIAAWVKECCEKNILLSGVIYMHDISLERMSRSSIASLEIFRELCGEDFYKNIAFVPNRWDKVSEEVGRKKLEQLKAKYWKPMIEKGASIFQYNGNAADAEDILSKMMQNIPANPKLGEELITDGKELVEAAGRIADKILAENKQKYEAEMTQISKAMKSSVNDKEMQDDLRKEAKKLTAEIERLDKEAANLRTASANKESSWYLRFGQFLFVVGLGVSLVFTMVSAVALASSTGLSENNGRRPDSEGNMVDHHKSHVTTKAKGRQRRRNEETRR